MKQQRPLSPHLQVYRLPKTALASITHRFTGIILSLSLLYLTCCLMSLASGPEAFSRFQDVMASWLGQIFTFFWVLSLMFHACHGTRHLIWDCGIGFSRERMDRLIMIEVGSALGLTVMVYFFSAIF